MPITDPISVTETAKFKLSVNQKKTFVFYKSDYGRVKIT